MEAQKKPKLRAKPAKTRLQIYIENSVVKELEIWAKKQGVKTSYAAEYLIQTALRYPGRKPIK